MPVSMTSWHLGQLTATSLAPPKRASQKAGLACVGSSIRVLQPPAATKPQVLVFINVHTFTASAVYPLD